MITLALDGLGGERVSRDCPRAIASFLKRNPDTQLLLVADATTHQLTREHLDKADLPRLQWTECNEKVGMSDAPVEALKRCPRSSIALCIEALKNNQVHAVLSFGHTGATVAAAQLKLGRLPGVERPGLAALLPNRNGTTLLMDVGANLQSKSSHLLQYGVMASAYLNSVLKLENPRIGLLNVGEEKEKGDRTLTLAHQLMTEYCPGFIGNVEGYQIFDGSVDGVICSGITGNIVLKACESLASLLMDALIHETTEAYTEDLHHFIDRHKADSTGACRLLGISGNVCIGHSNARGEAIHSALETTLRETRVGLQSALIERLATLEGRSCKAGTELTP